MGYQGAMWLIVQIVVAILIAKAIIAFAKKSLGIE
jgi:hypothetical protein